MLKWVINKVTQMVTSYNQPIEMTITCRKNVTGKNVEQMKSSYYLFQNIIEIKPNLFYVSHTFLINLKISKPSLVLIL